MRVGSEEQAHLPLGHKRLASPRHPRSTHAIDLSVRCGLSRARNRRRPRAAGLQYRSHAASSQRDRYQGHAWRTRHSDPRSSWMARRQRPQGSKQHLAPAAAATLTRTQPARKHLAIHAAELAVEPHLQILRRHRRPLLLRLEHAHRPALENHVHRPPRLGRRRSLIVRTGISLRTAPLTHSNPAKAVEGDRTGQGEVTLPPCCHWDSIFPGLPKQRSRDTTFLGADALHHYQSGSRWNERRTCETDMGAIMRLYWRSIERTNIVGAIRRFGLLPDLP